MGSLGEVHHGKEKFHGHPDPVVDELNRLENLLREKERELGQAYSEIKGLKVTEALKDKAIAELSKELKKQEEKVTSLEKQLEQKNLDVTRLCNERKEALAAQFAAEATLRRIHSSQKDEEVLPFDVIIAPLESDIKKYRHEIAVLEDDNKALERHLKLKETALVEAGNILRSALERALIVEDVQNQNIELRKQMEIYHEENKLLEKSNRQKVLEVEKLSHTISELEESILATGDVANVVRFYQNQATKLKEEKKTLERELALEPKSMSTVLHRPRRMNGKMTLISLCLSRDGWKNEGFCRLVVDGLWLMDSTIFGQASFWITLPFVLIPSKTDAATNKLCGF